MSVPDTHLFGLDARALQLWQQRSQVLANNLANADTPGFKARDIDFRRALAATGSVGAPLRLAATDSGVTLQGTSGSGSQAPLEYRVPMQPSLDGNTVNAQMEQSAFAQNAVHYEASLTFINAQIRLLRTAITGN